MIKNQHVNEKLFYEQWKSVAILTFTPNFGELGNCNRYNLSTIFINIVRYFENVSHKIFKYVVNMNIVIFRRKKFDGVLTYLHFK